MAQRSLAEIFYDEPVGNLTGAEIIVLDVPLEEEPSGPDDYQTQGSKIDAIRQWIINSIPYASGTNGGLMSSDQFVVIRNLGKAAKTNLYSDLDGLPALKTVATTGSYGDLSGKPTVASESTNGLMAAGDKTKLDQYPAQPPTALPPTGTAGGDLKGTYPNPTLADTISHGFTVAGPVAFESVSTPATNLSTLAAASTANFVLSNHNIGTLGDGVNVTFTFDPPQHSGFCVLTLFAPSSGTVPTVTLPGTVLGTVHYPTVVGQSTTTVFFWDGNNYCVVSSTPSH